MKEQNDGADQSWPRSVKMNTPGKQVKGKRSLIFQASLGLVVTVGLEPTTPSM